MTASAIAVLDIDGTLIGSNYHHALAWYGHCGRWAKFIRYGDCTG
ncbi:hypothetical protein [Streptomyces sp. NRRL S-1022]|nr:hypothetical protein [Streptomyces sp. NRRL S-1022]